jgi:hypothetical protein
MDRNEIMKQIEQKEVLKEQSYSVYQQLIGQLNLLRGMLKAEDAKIQKDNVNKNTEKENPKK